MKAATKSPALGSARIEQRGLITRIRLLFVFFISVLAAIVCVTFAGPVAAGTLNENGCNQNDAKGRYEIESRATKILGDDLRNGRSDNIREARVDLYVAVQMRQDCASKTSGVARQYNILYEAIDYYAVSAAYSADDPRAVAPDAHAHALAKALLQEKLPSAIRDTARQILHETHS